MKSIESSKVAESRYLIEDIKCGETECGVACGPCGGSTIVSIRCKKGNDEKWIHLETLEGFTNYIVTEDDLFDLLIDDEQVDQNIDMLNSIMVKDIDGIDVSESFSATDDCIEENPDNPAVPLIRIFEALCEYDDEERESFKADAIGRYADDIEVPKSRWAIRMEDSKRFCNSD